MDWCVKGGGGRGGGLMHLLIYKFGEWIEE